MSAALAMVARTWPCAFTYVGGSERTKNGVGIVVNNKEQIIHSHNPWDVLGYQVVEEAVTMFNIGAFDSASHILDNAQKNAVEANVKRGLATLSQLAKAYALWDLFSHNDSKKSLENAVEEAKKLGEDTIGQEHIMLGMIAVPDSDAVKAFTNSGFEDMGKLETSIRNEIDNNKKRKKILALLNETASKALVQAREEAKQNWKDFTGTEHILLGILKDPECTAAKVLAKLGADSRLLIKTIKEITPPGKEKPAETSGPHFDLEAKAVIDNAETEAKELGHNYIGTEHLLLGTLSVKTCAGASALNRAGISNIKKVRIAVQKELESENK